MVRLPHKSDAPDSSYLHRMQATAQQSNVISIVSARKITQCCDVPHCSCFRLELYLNIYEVGLGPSENTRLNYKDNPVDAV
jgi:hypothetical protein